MEKRIIFLIIFILALWFVFSTQGKKLISNIIHLSKNNLQNLEGEKGED